MYCVRRINVDVCNYMCLENEYLLNNLVLQSTLSKVDFWGWGGGGDSAYERGGDARLKF